MLKTSAMTRVQPWMKYTQPSAMLKLALLPLGFGLTQEDEIAAVVELPDDGTLGKLHLHRKAANRAGPCRGRSH